MKLTAYQTRAFRTSEANLSPIDEHAGPAPSGALAPDLVSFSLENTIQ